MSSWSPMTALSSGVLPRCNWKRKEISKFIIYHYHTQTELLSEHIRTGTDIAHRAVFSDRTGKTIHCITIP